MGNAQTEQLETHLTALIEAAVVRDRSRRLPAAAGAIGRIELVCATRW